MFLYIVCLALPLVCFLVNIFTAFNASFLDLKRIKAVGWARSGAGNSTPTSFFRLLKQRDQPVSK